MKEIVLAAFVVGPMSVGLASYCQRRFAESALRRFMPFGVLFFAGVLLALGMGGLWLKALSPTALSIASVRSMGGLLKTGLFSLMVFFLMDRLGTLRHCHEFLCRRHAEMPAQLFWGNAFHALVVGMVLALSFKASPALGWLSTLALLGHETSKALVSLVLLEEKRIGSEALLWNLIPSFFALPGALLIHLATALLDTGLSHLLMGGGAYLLFLALPDLTHRHHKQGGQESLLWLSLLPILGATLVLLLA